MTMDSNSLEPSAAISTTTTVRNEEIEVVNQMLDEVLVQHRSESKLLY